MCTSGPDKDLVYHHVVLQLFTAHTVIATWHFEQSAEDCWLRCLRGGFAEERQADIKLLEGPDPGAGTGKVKVLVPKTIDADDEDADDGQSDDSSDDDDDSVSLEAGPQRFQYDGVSVTPSHVHISSLFLIFHNIDAIID